MKRNKAQARKIGGSTYVKIDPYYIRTGAVKEGDWVDFDIVNIESNESEGISTVSYAFASFGGCYV